MESFSVLQFRVKWKPVGRILYWTIPLFKKSDRRWSAIQIQLPKHKHTLKPKQRLVHIMNYLLLVHLSILMGMMLLVFALPIRVLYPNILQSDTAKNALVQLVDFYLRVLFSFVLMTLATFGFVYFCIFVWCKMRWLLNGPRQSSSPPSTSIRGGWSAWVWFFQFNKSHGWNLFSVSSVGHRYW